MGMKKTINVCTGTIRDTCLEAESLLENWGAKAMDVNDMVLAIDEALTNIFEHGYLKEKEQECPVTIEIFKGKTKIYIILADYAIPFLLDNVKLPDMSTYVKSEKIGGLGIFIIKKIMDDVCQFQLVDENVLIMGKELSTKKDS